MSGGDKTKSSEHTPDQKEKWTSSQSTTLIDWEELLKVWQ